MARKKMTRKISLSLNSVFVFGLLTLVATFPVAIADDKAAENVSHSEDVSSEGAVKNAEENNRKNAEFVQKLENQQVTSITEADADMQQKGTDAVLSQRFTGNQE